MGTTRIEWTDAVWNPVTGCTPISPGCDHCYARAMARRLAGRMGYPDAPDEFSPVLHAEKLTAPLRWRKPRRVFVNSMGDLFHEHVPDEWIDQVFAVMAACPQHTFQVLTKRPARMRDQCAAAGVPWPLPNVWLGVTAEDQQRADERVPLLLQTPAAVRFVSCEPLLGPVDLGYWANTSQAQLDWVIVGGETGPGARPMHPDWARSLRDQCEDAGVPFFFKSHGRSNREPKGFSHMLEYLRHSLDGVEHHAFPEVR